MLYYDKTNTYRDKGHYIEEILEGEHEAIIKPGIVRKIILTEKAKMYLSRQKDYIRAFKTLKEGIDYTIEIEDSDKKCCVNPPLNYSWRKTMGEFYSKN